MYTQCSCIIGPLIDKKVVQINETQMSALRESFAKNAYPNKATSCKLATQLGLNESKVRKWFHNQRRKVARDKRQTLPNGENFVYVLICTVISLFSFTYFSCENIS